MSSSRTWSISSRKPPKCGATKKSAWMLVGAPIAPESRKRLMRRTLATIAAVLHHGMDAPGPPGAPRRSRAHSPSCRRAAFRSADGSRGRRPMSATSRRAAGTTTSNTTSGLVWSSIASRSVPIAAPSSSNSRARALGPRRASRSTRPTIDDAVDLAARPRARPCSWLRSRPGRPCIIPTLLPRRRPPASQSRHLRKRFSVNVYDDTPDARRICQSGVAMRRSRRRNAWPVRNRW